MFHAINFFDVTECKNSRSFSHFKMSNISLPKKNGNGRIMITKKLTIIKKKKKKEKKAKECIAVAFLHVLCFSRDYFCWPLINEAIKRLRSGEKGGLHRRIGIFQKHKTISRQSTTLHTMTLTLGWFLRIHALSYSP